MIRDSRKILLVFLILVIPAFIVKEYRILKAARESYVSTAVIPQASVKNQHIFTCVLVMHNNANFCLKSLNSVLEQDYKYYRVVIVDNGSTDQTFELMQNYIIKNELLTKNIRLIRHKDPMPLKDIYKEVFAGCADHEIIVLLKSTDWLAHSDVLSKLNDTYNNPDVWLAYGASRDFPSFKKHGELRAKNITSISRAQKTPWMYSGLRSFRIELMKSFHLDGQNESQLFAPMVEHSKWHIRYMPETLYIHNRLQSKTTEGHLQIGLHLQKLTTSMQAQSDLALARMQSDMRADLVIFSQNRPYKLNACLESVYRYVKGLDQITVVYQTESQHAASYDDLTRRYPNIQFYRLSSNFKPQIMQLLSQKQSQSQYIAFSTDHFLIKDSVSLSDCSAALAQTHAYAFCLDRAASKILPAYKNAQYEKIHISNLESEELFMPFSVVLYRKQELYDVFQQLQFTTPNSLLSQWCSNIPADRFGLYYDTPKVAKIH